MELLGGASKEGGSVAELCAAITSRKNSEAALTFSGVPYAERMVFLPQCLRNTSSCAAEERAAEYVCARCGACKVSTVVGKAEELGYMGVKILKGGSALATILRERKPRAVVGVACPLEGALGALECERLGVTVQFIPLSRDGCADTDLDLNELLETMGFLRP